MGKLAFAAVAFVGCLLIGYGCIAFVNWSANPGDWSEGSRISALIIGAGLSPLAVSVAVAARIAREEGC